VKVGDVIKYNTPVVRPRVKREFTVGTIVEFLPVSHAKQFQKVRVLTASGTEDWILQFCEAVDESR